MVVFMQCETVKIENESAENGYVVINKSDFDESKHKLFKGKSDGKKVRRKAKKEVID